MRSWRCLVPDSGEQGGLVRTLGSSPGGKSTDICFDPSSGTLQQEQLMKSSSTLCILEHCFCVRAVPS